MKSTQEYLEQIWDIGLNIVSCGECPAVLIVERADEHTCRFCGFTDDISGFGDFFIPGYDEVMIPIFKDDPQFWDNPPMKKQFIKAEDFLN